MVKNFTFKQVVGSAFIAPGEWIRPSAPEFKAVVRCPECKARFTVRKHDINARGLLSPSLVCPSDGCNFHVWATLEGWQ